MGSSGVFFAPNSPNFSPPPGPYYSPSPVLHLSPSIMLPHTHRSLASALFPPHPYIVLRGSPVPIVYVRASRLVTLLSARPFEVDRSSGCLSNCASYAVYTLSTPPRPLPDVNCSGLFAQHNRPPRGDPNINTTLVYHDVEDCSVRPDLCGRAKSYGSISYGCCLPRHTKIRLTRDFRM